MHSHQPAPDQNESDFKMADIKYIEPTPANIERLQIAFNEADCIVQGADEKIQAATHHIKLMLGEPDSCQVPCDHIPVRSWPFFRARALLQAVIASFKAEQHP